MNTWPQLSDVAYALLAARGPAGCRHDRLVEVTLSISFPAAPTTTSHALYVRREAGAKSYVLVVSSWKPGLLPLPTALSSAQSELEQQIEQCEIALSSRMGGKLQRAIEMLSIPLNPVDPLYGCDGAMVDVELGDHNCGIRCWWWEDAPECWAELGSIAAKIMELGGNRRISLRR